MPTKDRFLFWQSASSRQARELIFGQQSPEVHVETHDMLTLMDGGSSQPSVGNIVDGKRLFHAQAGKLGEFPPDVASSTPGACSKTSTKRNASAIGVGLTKILGCVIRRRKLASTIGCSMSGALCSVPETVCAS